MIKIMLGDGTLAQVHNGEWTIAGDKDDPYISLLTRTLTGFGDFSVDLVSSETFVQDPDMVRAMAAIQSFGGSILHRDPPPEEVVIEYATIESESED